LQEILSSLERHLAKNHDSYTLFLLIKFDLNFDVYKNIRPCYEYYQIFYDSYLSLCKYMVFSSCFYKRQSNAPPGTLPTLLLTSYVMEV